MTIRPTIAMIAGGLLTAIVAVVGSRMGDADFAAGLQRQALAIVEQQDAPVTARFFTGMGWPTRHPVLSGDDTMAEDARDRVAKAIAAVPGIGGVSWSDGSMLAQAGEIPISPLHCQEDVEALLAARTIRFEESSSEIAPASAELLDEVAAALRPCLGSIISIIGHTDASGTEAANMELSRERALAVEQSLRQRGIPADGMRATGEGSSQPVEGLAPEDPANRRIEFAVIATEPLQPTPVDTPGPR